MTSRYVLVSQRADLIADRDEWRDALDARIPRMLAECGLGTIPVPNLPDRVSELWGLQRPAGVLLTGGNDLVQYGGTSPDRDLTERILLELAIAQRVPVLGVCRGLQLIASHFGAVLEPVTGHVASRHEVHGKWGRFETNSYHNLVATRVVPPLRPVMHSADGHLEALEHTGYPIVAVMWHPEREPALAPHDRALIEGQFAPPAQADVA